MCIDISNFDKTKVLAVVEFWRSISPDNLNLSVEEILQCFIRHALDNEFNSIINYKRYCCEVGA